MVAHSYVKLRYERLVLRHMKGLKDRAEGAATA